MKLNTAHITSFRGLQMNFPLFLMQNIIVDIFLQIV